MESNQELPTAGYYIITLGMVSGKHILRSNNERAFVISQLQDLLGRRSLLEEPDVHRRLASHIDLLAFSILDKDIKCVLFAISRKSACTFLETISFRLKEYQREWQLAPSFYTAQTTKHALIISKLSGPYHALNKSVSLHLRHPDWEYDRYSSIGFYLHDRRGDWMHLWRIAKLYENNTETYRQLLSDRQANTTRQRPVPISQLYEPLWHAL